MKNVKKIVSILLALTLLVSLSACGGGASITVISREEGSGTRSAFVELTGIEQDDIDRTTASAEINSSTAVVMQTVAGNKNAIGYISLGSLNSTVKAVSVDGVAPSVSTVADGSYPIARPFNVATKEDLSAAAQDFLNFILSDAGQAIVTDHGCVSTASAGAFSSANPSGTVKVSGSSSVAPLMEKLAEAYMSANSSVTVQVTTSDSSTGMIDVAEGISDIGMASRAVKDSEIANGLVPTVICMDGIAVIVNNESETAGLTLAQICAIYTGETTSWDALR